MNKTTKSTFWLCVLITLTALACRKDIIAVFEGNQQQATIQWARDYYEQNLQQEQSLAIHLPPHEKISGIPQNGLEINKKTVQWDKVSSGVTEYYDFVETDITYDRKIHHSVGITHDPTAIPVPNPDISNASFDRLIIYKDKQGKINQRIISYIPDADYLKRHNESIIHNRIDNLDKDFFGYIQYRAWDGDLLFELRIENGNPVKKYTRFINNMKNYVASKSTSSKTPSKERVMVVDPGEGGGGGTPENCYHIVWDWYQNCYYADEHSVNPYYCDPVVINNVIFVPVPCPPDGGGGGGGNPGDPQEPPCLGLLVFETGECILVKDCAGVEGGTAHMSTCGCIGGTTGIDTCLKDPCNQAKIMNYKVKHPNIVTQNSIMDTSNHNVEWGATTKFYTTEGKNYMPSPVTTNGATEYTFDWSWDAVNGYAVGFNHTHNIYGYGAPSPDDVWKPTVKAWSSNVTSSGKQQFFMDNMWIGTRYQYSKYIVTVRDWNALYTLYNNKTLEMLSNEYLIYISDYAQAHSNSTLQSQSEYALMKVFGNTINFLKLNDATGKYEPWKIDLYTNTEKITCP